MTASVRATARGRTIVESDEYDEQSQALIKGAIVCNDMSTNDRMRRANMSNKIENNVSAPDPGQDTTLAFLVEKAERQAPSIMKIRHRIEGVLSRLTGPNEEPTAEDGETAGSLLGRLDNANDRISSEISQLEDEISRLETLA